MIVQGDDDLTSAGGPGAAASDSGSSESEESASSSDQRPSFESTAGDPGRSTVVGGGAASSDEDETPRQSTQALAAPDAPIQAGENADEQVVVRAPPRPPPRARPAPPPLGALDSEITPFLRAYAAKDYMSGYVYKSDELNVQGKPLAAADGGGRWIKWWAELRGAVLMMWAVPTEIAAAAFHPRPSVKRIMEHEVTKIDNATIQLIKNASQPVTLCVTDAVVELVPYGNMPQTATNREKGNTSPSSPSAAADASSIPPPIPYDNFLAVSTTGSNLFHLALRSSIAANAWAGALRLAAYEAARLCEHHTLRLLKRPSNYAAWSQIGLAMFKLPSQPTEIHLEGPIRVRLCYGFEWTELYVVISNRADPLTPGILAAGFLGQDPSRGSKDAKRKKLFGKKKDGSADDGPMSASEASAAAVGRASSQSTQTNSLLRRPQIMFYNSQEDFKMNPHRPRFRFEHVRQAFIDLVTPTPLGGTPPIKVEGVLTIPDDLGISKRKSMAKPPDGTPLTSPTNSNTEPRSLVVPGPGFSSTSDAILADIGSGTDARPQPQHIHLLLPDEKSIPIWSVALLASFNLDVDLDAREKEIGDGCLGLEPSSPWGTIYLSSDDIAGLAMAPETLGEVKLRFTKVFGDKTVAKEAGYLDQWNDAVGRGRIARWEFEVGEVAGKVEGLVKWFEENGVVAISPTKDEGFIAAAAAAVPPSVTQQQQQNAMPGIPAHPTMKEINRPPPPVEPTDLILLAVPVLQTTGQWVWRYQFAKKDTYEVIPGAQIVASANANESENAEETVDETTDASEYESGTDAIETEDETEGSASEAVADEDAEKEEAVLLKKEKRKSKRLSRPVSTMSMKIPNMAGLPGMFPGLPIGAALHGISPLTGFPALVTPGSLIKKDNVKNAVSKKALKKKQASSESEDVATGSEGKNRDSSNEGSKSEESENDNEESDDEGDDEEEDALEDYMPSQTGLMQQPPMPLPGMLPGLMMPPFGGMPLMPGLQPNLFSLPTSPRGSEEVESDEDEISPPPQPRLPLFTENSLLGKPSAQGRKTAAGPLIRLDEDTVEAQERALAERQAIRNGLAVGLGARPAHSIGMGPLVRLDNDTLEEQERLVAERVNHRDSMLHGLGAKDRRPPGDGPMTLGAGAPTYHDAALGPLVGVAPGTKPKIQSGLLGEVAKLEREKDKLKKLGQYRPGIGAVPSANWTPPIPNQQQQQQPPMMMIPPHMYPYAAMPFPGYPYPPPPVNAMGFYAPPPQAGFPPGAYPPPLGPPQGYAGSDWGEGWDDPFTVALREQWLDAERNKERQRMYERGEYQPPGVQPVASATAASSDRSSSSTRQRMDTKRGVGLAASSTARRRPSGARADTSGTETGSESEKSEDSAKPGARPSGGDNNDRAPLLGAGVKGGPSKGKKKHNESSESSESDPSSDDDVNERAKVPNGDSSDSSSEDQSLASRLGGGRVNSIAGGSHAQRPMSHLPQRPPLQGPLLMQPQRLGSMMGLPPGPPGAYPYGAPPPSQLPQIPHQPGYPYPYGGPPHLQPPQMYSPLPPRPVPPVVPPGRELLGGERKRPPAYIAKGAISGPDDDDDNNEEDERARRRRERKERKEAEKAAEAERRRRLRRRGIVEDDAADKDDSANDDDSESEDSLSTTESERRRRRRKKKEKERKKEKN